MGDKKQTKTLRTKLVVLPLTLLLAFLTMMVLVLGRDTQTGIDKQMTSDIDLLLESMVDRLGDNQSSTESIESVAEETVRKALETIKDTPMEEMDNREVTELARLLQVDKLNLYDTNGKITHSTVPSIIGWVSDPEHSIKMFQNSNESILVEDIREDSEGDFEGFFKYGAIKNSDGSVYQLGVTADHIVEIMGQFEMQDIVNQIAESEAIGYLGIIGPNSEYIAHSNESTIGTDTSTNENVKESKETNGIVIRDIKFEGVDLLAVSKPIEINGEVLGIIDIGITKDTTNGIIRKNLITILLLGTLLILLIGYILIKNSNEIIFVLASLGKDSTMMATGDFSMDVPDVILAREDEFGTIARANMDMKKKSEV